MTGETILHYRIDGQLGRGGMGVVFKATDLKLLRTVALKFIPDDVASDPVASERFLREARAASALDHLNVGTIFGVEQTPEGRLFIVMAYYEGETLAEVIGKGPMPRARAIGLAGQIAAGLAAAHAQGIVHRDMKPSNVILTREGVAKIVDFGLASVSGSTRITHTGARMGTPAYMSPQQAMGEETDHRTDLWSLGLMLLEMLSGKTPFSAPSVPAVLFKIVHGEAPIGDADPDLQPVLTKALSKDPSARFQSAQEFVGALNDLDASGKAGSAHALAATVVIPEAARSAANPRNRRAFAALGTVAVLALALLGIPSVRNALFPGAAPASQSAVADPSAHAKYLKAVELLELWEKGNNLDNAISLLQEAVKLDPNFALGFARLAEGLRIRNALSKNAADLQAALQHAETAARLNPNLPPVQTTLGRVYSSMGKNDLALAALTRSAELDANDGETQAALARVYERQGRIKEAEAAYERSVALQPDSLRNLNAYANFHYRRRNFPQAIQKWQRVTELSPENSPAWTNLGAALLEAGRLPEAEQAYQRAIAIKPNSTAYMNTGKVQYMRGRFAEAAAMFAKAAEMNPQDYIPAGNLAAALSWLPGKGAEAQTAFRKAAVMAEASAKRSPRDSLVHTDLGLYYAKLGRSRQSTQCLNTALALDEKNPATYAAAAEAAEILKNRDTAVAQARKAIELGYSRETMARNPELQGLLADPRMK